MDLEIGHINISVIDKNSSKNAVVNWHKDSYPFVCVLMLSDTTGMQGGETVLKSEYCEYPLSYCTGHLLNLLNLSSWIWGHNEGSWTTDGLGNGSPRPLHYAYRDGTHKLP